MSRGVGKRLKKAKKRDARLADGRAEAIADMWRRLARANEKARNKR
jgi:hypothetical protein